MITLDGVMQAPGSPDEDTSGGFKYGGWVFPFFDAYSNKILEEEMCQPFDLLLGRKTYDIWAPYWPKNKESAVGVAFDKATKYVVSHNTLALTWDNSVLIENNLIEEIKKLKAQEGPDLQVHGSGNLAQSLFKYDLVDEMRIRIFPITLGSGKHLFADGTVPAAYTLTKSQVSPSGIIFTTYKRAGEVKTGSFQK